MDDILLDDDYLAHYGVLGMKWGVRKDARNSKSSNPDYSATQRKRDRQVYGLRGEKRINKAMNKGDTISIARGREKHRRDKITGRNKYVRVAGKTAGGIAGFAAGQFGAKAAQSTMRVGHKAINNFFNKHEIRNNTLLGKAGGAAVQGMFAIDTIAKMIDADPMAKGIVSAGLATAGTMAAGDLAVKTRLRAHGYDPNKKY